jgi:hypothetical protein
MIKSVIRRTSRPEKIRHTSQNNAVRKTMLIAFAFTMLNTLTAHAQSQPANKLGQLLYESNCLTCHNTQSKWRDQKLAKEWGSLTAEVRRWQNNLGLRWDDKQITLVALYMNRRYYKFSAPAIVSQ